MSGNWENEIRRAEGARGFWTGVVLSSGVWWAYLEWFA